MIRSNKATYGYKWTIFGANLCLAILYFILIYIVTLISSDSGFFYFILMFIVIVLFRVANLGCEAFIYRNLTTEHKPEEMETVVEA